MDYIRMDELLSIERDTREMDIYDIKEEKTAERKEKAAVIKQQIRQATRQKLRSFFKWISKKAIFITSVPFYWFIIFRYIVGSVEMNLFIFVIAASFAISFFGNSGGWGLLNGLAA